MKVIWSECKAMALFVLDWRNPGQAASLFTSPDRCGVRGRR